MARKSLLNKYVGLFRQPWPALSRVSPRFHALNRVELFHLDIFELSWSKNYVTLRLCHVLCRVLTRWRPLLLPIVAEVLSMQLFYLEGARGLRIFEQVWRLILRDASVWLVGSSLGAEPASPMPALALLAVLVLLLILTLAPALPPMLLLGRPRVLLIL